MAPRVSPVPVRRQYTDLDYWRVYNHYVSTGQFTKKTARECYLSVSTVRAWIKKWDFDMSVDPPQARNPPQTPAQDELEKIQEDGDDISKLEHLTRLAMKRLEEVIPKSNSPDQLGRIIKDFSERIARAKGENDGQVPSTVNINLRLAEAQANGGALVELLRNTLSDAHQRQQHIDHDIEADEEPQRALAPASDSEEGEGTEQ